ncbi:MAG TPA: phosphoglycerate dehydrogenase [Terriglobales bacterium]|nr:phosphoglycerate dehydrogenase [Terriglobales bacterium]
MKIVIAEKTSPAAIALFRDEPKWHVVTADQINGDLAAQVADADALVVRSAVDVNAALLEHAAKLRVIGRAGVGVDNIDLEAATRHGIAVMNTPGANAVAVAEHTLALMLALARQLTRADATTRAGKWEKKSLQGSELKGKRLGIVGLGRVGLEVARRARAFGMEVLAHDPFVAVTIARELGIQLAPLDELYAAADYLTLHVGLTPQTAKMIDEVSLTKMKRGVRIINCARGELIDEAALAAALRSGHVAGAALDVFTEEPPKDSPLLAQPNVIATPHIAGSTHEAQEAVGVQIAMQVKEFLKHGVIQNAVNVPSLTHDEYVEMQPYMVLAERLGAFLAQAAEGGLQEVSLRYSGRMAEWKTELLRNAAIKGLLSRSLSERANLVNAASLAEELGLRVHEAKKTKAPGGGAGNVLSILVKTEQQEMLVKGAVLHGSSPRLLGVDDIDIEAPLERNVIYLRNRDVPGVIGRVGTILGAHQVNIANFALGREERKREGRNAIAVIQVDSAVPDAALTELRTFEAITFAKAMRF